MTYNKSNTHQKFMEATKAVLRGKFIGLHTYIRKDEIPVIINLSFYLTKLKE